MIVTLLSVKDSKQETFSVIDIHFPSFLSVCRFVADKNHFALLHVPVGIFSTISIHHLSIKPEGTTVECQ